MRGAFQLFLLHAILIGLLGISGCSGGGDSGSAFWGGGGGSASQTYSVSGTLHDTISNSPVQGTTCTLLQTKGGNFIEDFMRNPKETVTVSTATKGADGTYRFTGMASGTYTIRFTSADYITSEVNDLSVTGDTAGLDRTVVQTLQWTQLAGPTIPMTLPRITSSCRPTSLPGQR
ncbi:MAG: carboxypeptidase-like regulatory domain-containing protein [Candidatus Eremiobacteraeota bacterium]|nr:carboxypeptidase-like regulatory domain-containing protein [Candidatus Eremiobacteraeota bacterium]